MIPTVIRCDEVVNPPIYIVLGDIRLDVTRISAYDSIRLLHVIHSINPDTDADNTDAMVAASDVVMDIITSQCNVSEETVLQSGTQQQVNDFIAQILAHALKTYAPLERSKDPFVLALLMRGLIPAKPEHPIRLISIR